MTKEEFEKENEHLEKMRIKNIEAQDTMIKYLSSGGLVLSLTVYEKIYSGSLSMFLVITWISFSLSLLLNLLSQFTGEKSLDEQICVNDAHINNQKVCSCKFNFYRNFTIFLNRVSLFSFSIGTIIFIIFASSNFLNKEISTMTNNKAILNNGVTSSSLSSYKTTVKDGAISNTASTNHSIKGITSSSKSTSASNSSGKKK